MGHMRLTFAAALVISGAVHAEPIAFGPGDAPGTELEVVSRTVETHRAGARNPDASTLNTTLVARVERDARGRHVRVRLKRFGAESIVSDEPLMRIAGETELYLMEALTSVPFLLDVDDKGRVIGIADWDTTRRMLRQATKNRVAVLSTEKPMLHPGAALPADVVAETDARIAHGFVDLISNMKPDDFIDRFCTRLCSLGRPASNGHEAVEQVGRDFRDVPVIPRELESLRGPQFVPNPGERIAEGRRLFHIPAHAVG